MTAAEWSRHSPPYGGYFEAAALGGRQLMVWQTANHRWVVRVDGKPVRGSYATAEAARGAAVREVTS